jgi:hypothetical protein
MPTAVRVAVVIPFYRSDAFDRLQRTLQQWVEMRPCSSAVDTADKLHLFFNYAGDLDLDADVFSHLAQLWSNLPMETRNCFHPFRTWSCKLSAAENIYPIGPCLQFHETFHRLRTMGFDHWLLYEPDVLPIRPGWGTRLLELARQNQDCGDWWQLGSTVMHRNNVDQLEVEGTRGIDLHLNGNAIYCVKSSDFDEYRNLVSKTYHARGCYVTNIDDELAGYDHALYRFRMRLENREYMQGKFWKFKDDAFIRNFGEASFDVRKIRAMSPQTMLVHSKYFYAGKETQKILDQKYLPHDLKPDIARIYISALGRLPSASETDFFSRVFQPLYDDFEVMSCLFAKTISLCKTQPDDIGDLMSESCKGQGKLSDIFSSLLEATLTGQYIKTFAGIPGPEASELMCQSNEVRKQTTTMAALCGKKILADVRKKALLSKTLYTSSTYSVLADVQPTVQPCTVSESSLLSCNRVLMGSYRLVCDSVEYDDASDSLSCQIGTSKSTLQHPYRCAADISVDPEKKLAC